MFPLSINVPLNRSIHLFKVNYFSVKNRLLQIFQKRNKRLYLTDINYVDFDNEPNFSYDLDIDIWKKYRSDQKYIIQRIINTFFKSFGFNYFNNLYTKITLLLKLSKTNRVIIDETNDVLRRLVIMSCNTLDIKIDFLPHGIVSEDQHTYISRTLPTHKNFQILAWNKKSSLYFNKHGLRAMPISYPIKKSIVKKNKYEEKKDILVMLSGGRVTLNSYENAICNIFEALRSYNLKIDWKYHQLLDKGHINIMSDQKKLIEDYYTTKIESIHHETLSYEIIKNYKKIIFTSWTTGIFEAALLNVPFIIYTKDISASDIHSFDGIDLPIANTQRDLRTFFNQDRNDYLKQISLAMTENLSLSKYFDSISVQ